MKIQQHQPRLPSRPPAPKPAPEVVLQDTVESSRWQKIGQTIVKGAAGAAVGMIPAAAAGYAIASWGGIPGAILGGCVGAGLGYLSGKQIREVAEKVAAKNPEKLNFVHKTALKMGAAAPYAWAAVSAAAGALAGATFSPVVAAMAFGKNGSVAGALIMGTKH